MHDPMCNPATKTYLAFKRKRINSDMTQQTECDMIGSCANTTGKTKVSQSFVFLS